MPSSSHSRSSGSDDRKAGENWFCTLTSRPPRTSCASRICAGFALEMPAIRIFPASSRSRSAPTDSAYGTDGSGRWNWYSPIASTPSAVSDASHAARRCSGEPSTSHRPSGRTWPPLVATSTSDASPPHDRSASPMSRSLCPVSASSRQ